MERQRLGDLAENRIALRIAPQDEVAILDVLVGDFHVVDDDRLAAELTPPLIDGAFHFAIDPLGDDVVRRRSRRPHERERPHERVVDRSLQAVAFDEASGGRGNDSTNHASLRTKCKVSDRSEAAMYVLDDFMVVDNYPKSMSWRQWIRAGIELQGKRGYV